MTKGAALLSQGGGRIYYFIEVWGASHILRVFVTKNLTFTVSEVRESGVLCLRGSSAQDRGRELS